MRRVRLGAVLATALVLAGIIYRPSHEPHINVPIIREQKATMEEKNDNRNQARAFLRALGYNNTQIKCMVELWTRESRFDHFARPRTPQGKPRSSAYGIAQLLRERSSDPAIQTLHGIRYVERRYPKGAFCAALRHSDRHGWY